MIYDSLAWWQIAIRTVWIVMGLVGVGVLVRRPKFGIRDAAQMMRRRVTGGVLIGVALLGTFTTQSLTSPRETPLPKSEPVPTRVDGSSFSSSAPPGLRIAAPERWRTDFDATKKTLRVIRGPASVEDADVQLHIESARLTDRVDLDRLLDATSAIWINNGLTPGKRFDRSIGGMPGRGVIVATPNRERSFATTMVRRSDHHVSTMQCFVTNGSDPMTACDAPLERVEWLEPDF